LATFGIADDTADDHIPEHRLMRMNRLGQDTDRTTVHLCSLNQSRGEAMAGNENHSAIGLMDREVGREFETVHGSNDDIADDHVRLLFTAPQHCLFCAVGCERFIAL
jgi:hypothetical protein